MLKEKKKLLNKIETLSRKVQTLQTKVTVGPPFSSTSAHIPTISSAPLSSNPIPHVPIQSTLNTTVHPHRVRSQSDNATPIRSHPVSGLSSLHKTPERRATHTTPDLVLRTRAVSGPSSLHRSRTPERKSLLSNASRTRTPERRTPHTTPDPAPFTSLGTKRKAPADFETCDSVPRKGFTVDSLPSDDPENTTPQFRRVLHNVPGFTPVRSRIPSPKKEVSVVVPIADVTNNPRSKSHQSASQPPMKRSWLGKIKGASSQSTSRAPYS